MIEQAYPYLILTGATIGLVLFYLWRQATGASHVNLALIRLNEELGFDAPNFLRRAWPLLARAGLLGLEWELDWFGVKVGERHGRVGPNGLRRELEVGEMRLVMSVYKHDTRGERCFFDDSVIETFLLLLRTDMWIKAGATDATFTQMAKLNLFLQHDMKNIAQFIQLMGDQLAAIPPGREQQALDYLCTAVPLIRHRADRIVRSLTTAQAPGPRSIDLREELTLLCQLYRLECAISGDARVHAGDAALSGALDNILKNYRDHTIKPRLRIHIGAKDGRIMVTIHGTNASTAIQLERLFEPFWSSDPNGLGIGLYQAKQLLERSGGALDIDQSASGAVRFHLCFPCSEAQDPPASLEPAPA